MELFVHLHQIRDKFHVPIGLKHQMFALKDTELFEFSTQHFDSDSNRIERGD